MRPGELFWTGVLAVLVVATTAVLLVLSWSTFG